MARKPKTAHNSTLRPGKPPDRKPLRKRVSRKEASAKRKGSKRRKSRPGTRRGQLIFDTEPRMRKLYRGLPCAVCKHQGRINTDRTCGHHLVRVSRCRKGRYDPANVLPVCPGHHRNATDLTTEGDTLPVSRFADFMRRHMPKRWAHAQELEDYAKKHSGEKLPISEIETEYALWLKITENSMSYEDVCRDEDVEAWAGPQEIEVDP